MEPVLQLISNGLGKFVNKLVERSECTEKNSEATEVVESSEIMETANSFDIAELSASSTQKESAKDPEVQSAAQDGPQCLVPDKSAENIECVPSEPIKPSGSDQVMQFSDFLKMVATPTAIDPDILNDAGAPETVNSVEVAETVNCLKNSINKQNDVPQFCVRLVSTRYCQTGDQAAESGVVKSTETSDALEVPVVMVNYVDPSQRPKFADSAVQTMEVDEELLPIQPARKSKETSPADSVKMVASESVTSSVVHESNNTFATADSSGTLASPECAETMDSPSSSESWTFVQSVSTIIPVAHPQENSSAEAAKKINHVESTDGESSTKIVGENCSEVGVEKNCKSFTELTPVKNPAKQVNDSTKSWINESAEANLESYLQISAVELSSTSFTLEDGNLLPDDENSFYDVLKNWYDTDAVAITFDGSCNDQPSVTNYGDVSSTNTLVGGDVRKNLTTELKTSQKFTNSMPDLTALLRECGLDEEFESEEEQCKEHSKEPVTKQCKEPVTEQRKEPAIVNPNYPAVVATSPDSTEDGLQLRVLPCNVIVPRMENKFPQYAYLVRRAIKRKKELSENSILKKKFCSEINQKIPLGSCQLSNSQSVSKLQRPEENKCIGNDFSSSGFKRPKSKKSKRSRESHELKSVRSKSKPPELVARFVSPPKADFTNYHIPKLKIAPAKTINGKKENIPKRLEVSKRKSSDASDNRGSPLCPKNPKVSSKRRDSDTETEVSLKHSKCVKNKELSSKHQPILTKCKDGEDSSRAPSARNKSHSSRRNESKSSSTENPLQTGSQNHSANVREDLPQSDTLILPGMPELSPWETLDFDVIRSQQPASERTLVPGPVESDNVIHAVTAPVEKDNVIHAVTAPVEKDKVIHVVTAPVEKDKVIHVHDFPKFVSQMVTYINSPERRENLPDPIRIEPSKCILKNKYSGLPSSNRKVRFGSNHGFRIIDCEDELWYPFHCLLPEPHILGAINHRYSLEAKKAKLLSLRWVHRCHHPESRSIRSPVNEPKLDGNEYMDEFDKSAFEKHTQMLIHSRLHKVIFDTEYRAETTNEIEFVIDVVDTSEKECWNIILKRKTDLKETEKFKVGDVVSLTLFTKSKNLNGKWKETIIFGYTEEVGVKVKGDHQIQKICLSVHPIHHEVKRDQVKIQTVVNIGKHLRLLTASAVIPYSEVVDLFTSSSTRELKSDATQTNNEFIESEQSHAVNSCYEGILSKDPFLYFVDGAAGTGKSHFIVKLVQTLYSKKEELDYVLKVLIVTQSHASGDDILQRLVKSPSKSINFNILRYGDIKTIHPSLKKYVLADSNYILQKENLSFDIDLEKRIFEAEKNVQKEQEASVINKPAEANVLRKRYVEEIVIGSAHVVIVSQDACYKEDFLKDFTPCASNHGIFNKFTVCIFDDANEMCEVDMLIPVMTMASNLILIGDCRNPSRHDVSLTPFSQLLGKYRKTFPKCTINFKTQFRVHPKIVDCLSKMKMNVNSTPENTESKLALKPLMIVDLVSEDESLDHSKNFEAQAKLCKNIVQNIRGLKEFENLHVGVMVGKKRQKDIITEELKSCSPDTLVDKYVAYCGLERDVIVACLPVFLFPEKFLYTAMTRAKRSVIICGDFSRYKGQETIDQLVTNAKRRKCFQRWEKDPLDFPFRTMRLFLNKNNEVTSS